jgi:Fe-Mn family superoxide dismutase
MPVPLAPLPYALDALEPVISAEALSIHHGRHYGGYVARLNAAIAGNDYDGLPLEHIVRRAARGRTTARRVSIFHNAAQAWNHEFFFSSLRPAGGAPPRGDLAARIARDFRSHEALAEAFSASAMNVFGSGWAWLVVENGILRLVTTPNADTPIAHGRAPLLAIDVWEHAYYLDHQERRAEYLAGVAGNLLDWDFAERNLKKWASHWRAPVHAREAGHAW